ncbi:antibiotic biosynthesis monooxygenase family protein [Actinomadura sp. 21ATH]|uniref:antibiotic biosynthesis monooxygenase family protein n=1 Tax=Actinomadura sp. 21ATH TaxID=1735444 RepID=UPI0035BF3903
MSVVKINVLTVPEPMREELERRFAKRAGLVDEADGFEYFELLRPVDGTDRYLVYTRWRDDASFKAWMEGQAFQRGHSRSMKDEQEAKEGKEPNKGHGGPAATGSEQWSFEVIESTGPKD